MKKREFIILALGLILSFNAAAQDTESKGAKAPKKELKEKKHGMPTPQERATNMAQKLSLTDDEKAKVEAFYSKQQAEQKQKLGKNKPTPEQIEQAKAEFLKAEDAEMKNILSAEKFKKYKQLQKKQANKGLEGEKKKKAAPENE